MINVHTLNNAQRCGILHLLLALDPHAAKLHGTFQGRFEGHPPHLLSICPGRCFGFDTAVEEAQRALLAAKVEASSARNGIGLVKLMGRQSGFIAMQASMASGRALLACGLQQGRASASS